MGANSKIEWTTHTFNPWVGCTKVSAACDHCYAESWAKRAGNPELWQGARRRTSHDNWRKPLKWDKAAAAAGERHRVFCASLADVFDNQVPNEWRRELWILIATTPHLDWLLLTKRPQNIPKMLPKSYDAAFSLWPWPNVWLGTTVENQEEANRRIPPLLAVPAVVHFISAEPLLEPITLPPGIGWAIIGGESGGQARPFNTDWAKSIVEQCRGANVACFVKQLGAHVVQGGERRIKRDKKGGDMSEWPHEIRVREFPTVRAA